MTNTLADDELWAAVVADNSRAFTVLYDRYWKTLYDTAGYYLNDHVAAEEITHDVFVGLWTRRKHTHIHNFHNYILVATRYHVFRHLKAARKDVVEYMDQFNRLNNVTVDNYASVKLQSADEEYELDSMLKDLPKRCYEIFRLSRIENLSNEEIAGKLNISKRTVENQITHALKHLRSVYPRLHRIAMVVMAFVTFHRGMFP